MPRILLHCCASHSGYRFQDKHHQSSHRVSTVATRTPNTDCKTSALTHNGCDREYMRVSVENHAEGNIEPYFNQMWFTVFLVLMMIVHGPYFSVNSRREGACSQRRCGESLHAKLESVIGRPQNTSSLTGSEAECRVAVCVGVLRNSTVIPWALTSERQLNGAHSSHPILPHICPAQQALTMGFSPSSHHAGMSAPAHHAQVSPTTHNAGWSAPTHLGGLSEPTQHAGVFTASHGVCGRSVPVHHSGLPAPVHHTGRA